MKPIVCLLIDDDSEESEIFHYALEEMELKVKCHSVTSGKDALSFLNNGQIKPDYIFLDLNMPRMNGKQCLREIRKIRLAESIPVILYSTSFLDGQKQELELLGASGFINKTTSVFDLFSALNDLLNSRKEKDTGNPAPLASETMMPLITPLAGFQGS